MLVSSRYLLPASLVLLTLSVDLKGILSLGPRAVFVFLAGTVGVVIGGPVAVWVFARVSPETVGGVGPDAVWRGLATVAGSWIGGAASAPIDASAFHPALAPVGVLLAVLGYVLGTHGAWVCGLLMQGVAP